MRTGPNSGSRHMMGFWVPHLKLLKSVVLMKYTSHLKGEEKPYSQLCKVVRMGKLLVCNS